MTRQEIERVEAYLRRTFGNDRIALKTRNAKQADSVEVLIDGEFIGVLYRDDEEGEVSYAFNMAILEMDLPKLD
ncbi:MAG: DUF3126 family protein [Rhodothalassiaceae bacterium]